MGLKMGIGIEFPVWSSWWFHLEEDFGWFLYQESSWAWRKLLRLKDAVRAVMKFIIGKGDSKFYLSHDNWHPKEPPYQNLGHRYLYASSNMIATLLSVIHNWKLVLASYKIIRIRINPKQEIWSTDQAYLRWSYLNSYCTL